jgi:cell division protease FtsH
MKFATNIISFLAICKFNEAFVPLAAQRSRGNGRYGRRGSTLSMAMDQPPLPPTTTTMVNSNLPALQVGGGPNVVRYSDFLRLVKADRMEKVTFSSDGTQLLGVDVDGARVQIEALPNDPDLLTELTHHKVRHTKTNPILLAKTFSMTIFSFEHGCLLFLFVPGGRDGSACSRGEWFG